MQYFISWTHSDPQYHLTIPNIGVLVSPPNVSLSWTTAYWGSRPKSLIIDSGAFQYHRRGATPSPKDVFDRQMSMIAAATVPVRLCHLDVPLIGTKDLGEIRRRIALNLANAQWLLNHIAEIGVPSSITPVGVIQGHTVEQVYTAALTLAEMGYTAFALGSLSSIVASSRARLIERVEAALEAVGPNIHILGVSSVDVIAELAHLGIASVDSSAPMHEAYRGGIFYSEPFRRYKIDSPYFMEWRRSYNFAEILADPPQCTCPVCIEDTTLIMQPKGKRYINLRATHNCFHLAREIQARATKDRDTRGE